MELQGIELDCQVDIEAQYDEIKRMFPQFVVSLRDSDFNDLYINIRTKGGDRLRIVNLPVRSALEIAFESKDKDYQNQFLRDVVHTIIEKLRGAS